MSRVISCGRVGLEPDFGSLGSARVRPAEPRNVGSKRWGDKFQGTEAAKKRGVLS